MMENVVFKQRAVLFDEEGGQFSVRVEKKRLLWLPFKPALDLNGEPKTCLGRPFKGRVSALSSSLPLTVQPKRYTFNRQEIPLM